MPARRRRRPGGAPDVVEHDLSTKVGRRAAQSDAAKVFSARQKDQKDVERAEARAHREAAEREERRRALLKAKEDAAAHLKDVRRRADASAEERAAADAAYRAALDAVLRDEQGLPPADDDEIDPAAAQAPAD
jgi:hypothetical protein